MKKYICFATALFFCLSAHAQTIETTSLNLSEAQTKRTEEIKETLKQEVEPIIEEIEASRNRILEIEKKHFEEFWNLLTEEQKETFTKLNQQQ